MLAGTPTPQTLQPGGKPMHSFTPPRRPHPGLHVAHTPTGRYLEVPPAPPSCNDHDTELVEVDDSMLPESFEARLRDSANLFACPKCFQGDDGLDASKLGREIAGEWPTYREHFTTVQSPDMDRRGPTFEFR